MNLLRSVLTAQTGSRIENTLSWQKKSICGGRAEVYSVSASCKEGYDEIRWTEGEAAYYLNGEEYRQPEPEQEPEQEDAA